MKKIKEICQNIIQKTSEKIGSIEAEDIMKLKQEELNNGYRKILHDWMLEDRDIKPPTKAAKRAILKVAESDIPQADWEFAEWTVFIARAIIHRADHVNIYDLYLLHEIMVRCQEDA